MRQFFANRNYDLNQLQWLQKNARLYMTGLTIMAFLLAVALWLYWEPWQPQNSMIFWEHNESDQVVAEQQIPEKTEDDQNHQTVQQGTVQKQATGKEDTTPPSGKSSATEPANTVEPMRKALTKEEAAKKETVQQEAAQQGPAAVHSEIEVIEPKKETTKTVDLFSLSDQLSGFATPCSGELVYRYGIGYDPVYDDYRFHDAVGYRADGAEALAVADGVVQAVDLSGEWQLVLNCGQYQVRYQGLQTCGVSKGTAVTGGQNIGTADNYLCVQVIPL